jgi:hypothetical protein
MTSHAKGIDPSLRSRIETVKSRIRTTARMFDDDGYVFLTALKELRQEGYVIAYHKTSAVYTVKARPGDHAALTAWQTACLRCARNLAEHEETNAMNRDQPTKGDRS